MKFRKLIFKSKEIFHLNYSWIRFYLKEEMIKNKVLKEGDIDTQKMGEH